MNCRSYASRKFRAGASLVLALAGTLAMAFALTASPAAAEDAETPAAPAKALTFSGVYKLDVMEVADGGVARGARVLDNLNLFADADLDAAFGWKGATVHVNVLSNHGGRPNELAGSLQAIDNIEVSHARLKVYEAWIEQSLANGKVALRAGLYDTNSEFNVTDSSAVFLQPTFGVSTEISATGPAGPSIFPSTALGARLNLQPAKDVYARVAVVNAQAGTPGDPQGVNTDFSAGAIVFAEAGWTARGKLAVGAWTYTHRQDDLRDLQPTGEPVPRHSRGAYVLIDQPIVAHEGGVQASAFLRVGVSDGDTTPFSGAVSAGVSATHLIPSRPDGVLALGVSAAGLTRKFRMNSYDLGAPLKGNEAAVELTYADKLGKHLTLQPDLQYVRHPGGDPKTPSAVVAGLRATFSF